MKFGAEMNLHWIAVMYIFTLGTGCIVLLVDNCYQGIRCILLTIEPSTYYVH